MDNFLCCGTRYRAVRDALAQFLLEKKSDTFMAEIQVRETPELIGSPVTILDILLPSTCFPVFLCYISTVLFPPQKLRGSQISLLALAVFRQVTCRYKSPDGSIHPSPQVTIQDVWCGLCLFINVFPLFNILLYFDLTGDGRTERTPETHPVSGVQGLLQFSSVESDRCTGLRPQRQHG